MLGFGFLPRCVLSTWARLVGAQRVPMGAQLQDLLADWADGLVIVQPAEVVPAIELTAAAAAFL